MKKILVICCIVFVTDVIGQIVVNPDGTHSVVVGNVAVNPNGTHSVIVGGVAVNSDGTHSTAVGNVIVNPNGTHSTIVGSGSRKADVNLYDTHNEVVRIASTRIVVNPYGNHFTIIFNGNRLAKPRQKEEKVLSVQHNHIEKRGFFSKIQLKRKLSRKNASR